MMIDIEELREELKQECYGAAFCGGFGGALVKSHDVEKASPEELVRMAEKEGIDLRRFEVDGY